MPIERNPCVYVLASGRYGTLYIGVTSDLPKRLWQHRESVLPGFSSRYRVYRLVHFEMFGDMEHAIAREKQLKNWRRQWKINLINAENPEWRGLSGGGSAQACSEREAKWILKQVQDDEGRHGDDTRGKEPIPAPFVILNLVQDPSLGPVRSTPLERRPCGSVRAERREPAAWLALPTLAPGWRRNRS